MEYPEFQTGIFGRMESAQGLTSLGLWGGKTRDPGNEVAKEVPFRHAKKKKKVLRYYKINGFLIGFESERNRPKGRLSLPTNFSAPNHWFAVSACVTIRNS